MNIIFPSVNLLTLIIKNKPIQAKCDSILFDLNLQKELNRQFSLIYRDSNGRFRKEVSFYEINQCKEPIVINIIDPLKGLNYFLRIDDMTGKIVKRDFLIDDNFITNNGFDFNLLKNYKQNQIIEQNNKTALYYIGEQNIEGLDCFGIKFQEFSNGKITIIEENEMWFSIYLMELIKSVRTKNNQKEIIYLYDICLTEPDSKLFDCPLGFRIT